ncbi:MAG: tyrosine-type recombinase/integrase, partial [Planctomycetota bacterium]
KAEILQGRYNFKAKLQTPRFEEFASKYLEYSKANKRSYRRDIDIIKALMPHFKSCRLSQITPEMVEKYKLERIKVVCKATVNRELDTFSSLFNRAIEWGRAETNPLRGVKDFKVDNRKERILSSEEEKRLLVVAPQHLKPILLVALHTGMRLREILNLPWECVDLEQGVVAIRGANSKNGRERKVPMNEVLKEVFTELYKGKDNLKWVFFNQDTQKPVGWVKRSFTTACKRAGIEGLRFHDLRHTFATRLVLNGVYLVTVKELLGHVEIETTMRYSHPTPLSKTLAVDTLLEGFSSGDGHQMDTWRTPERCVAKDTTCLRLGITKR